MVCDCASQKHPVYQNQSPCLSHTCENRHRAAKTVWGVGPCVCVCACVCARVCVGGNFLKTV